MDKEVQSNPIESQSISSFYYSVAEYNILLESGIKTEIIEKKEAFPIPHAPKWCDGMISLRGKLIPVVNLHTLLNTSKQNHSHWLLVLEIAPYPQLALRIDQLPKQQSFHDQQSESLASSKLPSWLNGVFHIDGNKLYEADHTVFFEQLIKENELTTMKEEQPTPNQDSSGNDS